MKETTKRKHFDEILNLNEALENVIRTSNCPTEIILGLKTNVDNAKLLGESFDESWKGSEDENPNVVLFLNEIEKLILLASNSQIYKDKIKFLSKAKMYLNDFIMAHGKRFYLN